MGVQGRRGRIRSLEAELRATEDRYRSLAESAVEAVFTADRRGRITYVNSAGESLFGYAPGLLIGEELTVLMPERHRAAHRAGLALVAATGRTTFVGKVVGLSGLKSDGTEFEIELALEVWLFEGEVSFSALLRDVSQRGAAQEREELMQAALRSAGGASDLQAAVEALAATLERALPLERLTYNAVDGLGEVRAVADWASGAPVGAFVVAPMAVGDRVIGRLDVGVAPSAVVGAGQVAVVEQVAREVSGVLHTLYLLDRERHTAQRLSPGPS